MSFLSIVIYAGWGLMGLGFLLGWAYVALRAAKGLPPLATEPRPSLPNPVLDATLHVLTIPCIIVAYVLASMFAIDYYHFDASIQLETASPAERIVIVKITIFVTLVALLAATPLALVRYSSHWHDLWLHVVRAPRDLLLGVVAYTMLAVPVLILQAILTRMWPEKSHPFIDILRNDPDPQFLFVTAIAAVVVAPVAEEFFFRVLLQGLLERISSRPGWQLFVDAPPASSPADAAEDSPHEASVVVAPSETHEPPLPYPADPGLQPAALPPAPVVAPDSENPFASPHAGEDFAISARPKFQRPPAYWPIVISSLVFAAAHIGQGPAPFPLFVFALGLGYVYRCTHRVFPCMVMHFSLNFFTMLQLWQFVSTQG